MPGVNGPVGSQIREAKRRTPEGPRGRTGALLGSRLGGFLTNGRSGREGSVAGRCSSSDASYTDDLYIWAHDSASVGNGRSSVGSAGPLRFWQPPDSPASSSSTTCTGRLRTSPCEEPPRGGRRLSRGARHRCSQPQRWTQELAAGWANRESANTTPPVRPGTARSAPSSRSGALATGLFDRALP